MVWPGSEASIGSHTSTSTIPRAWGVSGNPLLQEGSTQRSSIIPASLSYILLSPSTPSVFALYFLFLLPDSIRLVLDLTPHPDSLSTLSPAAAVFSITSGSPGSLRAFCSMRM